MRHGCTHQEHPDVIDTNWVIYSKSIKRINKYRVVFLTVPPDIQYQNEKQVAANQD